MAPTATAEVQPLSVRPGRAAEMLGISRLKVYKLISSGALKAKKDGNTRLILVADLHAYLDSLPYNTDIADDEDDE